MSLRIAKFISNAGYCSRREAEKLILKKKVFINNNLCKHPSEKVSEIDVIQIDDKIIRLSKEVKLWKLHKPIKYICSTKDHLNRKKIFDLLPKNIPKLISVGRLDYMSEGLILLTNSGEYSRYLELPESKIERTYKVLIDGKINYSNLKKINKGITIEGITYNEVKVIVERKKGIHSFLIFKLKEGKNREIRKICKFFSWKIVKLIRISFGPYKLGNLKVGQLKEIKIIKND